MNSLGMLLEEAEVSSAALQKYAELFSNPLSAIQIKALAALFGWSPPKGLDGQGAALLSLEEFVFGSFVFVSLWILPIYCSGMFGVAMVQVVKQVFRTWLPQCILLWYACKRLR
jgi:hypothetical protein